MHPIASLLDWFPDCDFAVFEHGFLPHGRDYSFLVETNMGTNPGRHQLQFTHVVELQMTTGVQENIWPASWGEEFVDFQAWQNAGEPQGYVWGTNWSNAWPGLSAVEPSSRAQSWSKRLGKNMFEASLKTDRLNLSFVFHSLRTRKLSNDTSTISASTILFES